MSVAVLLRYPHLAALFCGMLATLTLPPIHIFPLLIPAFGGLFWLLQQQSHTPRQGFTLGWCFGLGYFVSGLYWFAYSLLVDAAHFAWMIPFAVLGLPSILAIYYGVAAVLFHLLRRWTPHPFAQAALFAVIWMAVELARGHWFTGFPWNLVSLTWAGSLPMMQMAAIIGSYGLTCWTVLLAILPVVAWMHAPQRHAALSVCALMLALPFGYGLYRLEHNPTRYTDVTLKLVQPSIPQQMKMREDQRVAMVRKQVEMSRPEAGEAQADLVIWSETAYPFLMQSYAPPLKFIAAEVLQSSSPVTPHLLRDMGASQMPQQVRHDKHYLITGGVRINGERITNSLNVVGSDATIVQHYDKVKLVPFGEFIPLRRYLPATIKSVAQGMQDFSAGKRSRQIALEGIPPFTPLICYEVIFPEMAASEPGKRPGWLLNITNDGWFGVSSGPYQHFAMARMRAVEQGLPLVRVANNGISAGVDGLGRIVDKININQLDNINISLPLPQKNTIYARFNEKLIFFISAILLLCPIFIQKIRKHG